MRVGKGKISGGPQKEKSVRETNVFGGSLLRTKGESRKWRGEKEETVSRGAGTTHLISIRDSRAWPLKKGDGRGRTETQKNLTNGPVALTRACLTKKSRFEVIEVRRKKSLRKNL